MKLNLPSKGPLIIVFVVGLLVLAAIPSYYFYDKYQKSQLLLKNPTEAAKQEVKTLVAQVGKHIDLPNEEPTVATVSDKDKLSDQAFFQKAENGDKVLIYTQARKAILFRPSTSKIIEVSTVNLGGGAGEATASGSVTLKPTVVLLNGTNIAGLTKTVERQLVEKEVNIEVVARENAKKQDYTKAVIVDLTGNQKAMAQELASILGGEISSLPEGEDKPKADLLIILGSDLK
jgi:uncharacterized protein YneF (UPF0154 family)